MSNWYGVLYQFCLINVVVMLAIDGVPTGDMHNSNDRHAVFF